MTRIIGNFEENYKDLLERNFENIHLYRKYVTQKEISESHKKHGVLLCPTKQDTQGVTMCEAMSSGLVVITNKIAAIPEYINDSCGILCENENALQMADAMEWLVQNRKEFLNCSKNAAEFIRGKCSFNNTILAELGLLQY